LPAEPSPEQVEEVDEIFARIERFFQAVADAK
jgi:hypothetical protein